MTEEKTSKQLLKIYGIASGILLVMAAILAVMIFASARSWQNGLRQKTAEVLEREEPGIWSVGDFVKINSPFSLSCACYKLRKKSGGEKTYAVILRISTIYGPFPAVFTCTKDGDAHFVGFSGLNGRIADLSKQDKADMHIQYWTNRIAKIIDLDSEAEK